MAIINKLRNAKFNRAAFHSNFMAEESNLSSKALYVNSKHSFSILISINFECLLIKADISISKIRMLE